MSQIAWGKFVLFTVGVMGAGYGVMKIATPSDEQFYNALAPDLKRKVDQIRAQRATSEEMRTKLAESAAQDKIVWGEVTPSGPKRV
ncbi:hypothetical protein FFLO_05152 [Filobasidium floriforme]|uniref:Cytochrome b mRNA-processing protein 4 n=1 Tax=Filobasidium floriforme TaxID=5210 RepID=A0A8K0JHI7_9TREE|nr:uncharacterized protein HD553DRAFT_303661 [Filobasidium floriforme]KAG7530267.1 hypothetical protein FFLO_05152 [Filobasidium floriforme]KAH8090889.1 hypothetical protein HD553DRAFT_303661 [Filobasidium floriforme]